MNKLLLLLLSIALSIVGYLVSTADASESEVLTLSESNTVSLNLPITEATATNIQQGLLNLSQSNRKSQPIYLVLNSPGGSIDVGRHIIDTALSIPQQVHTISMFSASMSFIISQSLGIRYAMDSSTLMSHRASVDGMGGQMPGSLITRVMSLLVSLTEIDSAIAKRAGLDLLHYRALIANELWMTGREAVDLKFADKLVRVYCDKSLSGPGPSQTFDLGFIKAEVQFHKCPLITAPIKIELSGERESYKGREQERSFIEAIYNKKQYVKNHSSFILE